jgi:hypothetical protein
MYRQLQGHLFPGDGDEHGAVIEAGWTETASGPVLLARELFLAQEGVDWVPGKRGYRMLLAPFILQRVRECRDSRLVYLAVHNHGGRHSVDFSGVDLESHERGFPALLDIVDGMPVGSLVFAQEAVAGDIWLRDGRRLVLDDLTIVGSTRTRLRPRTRAARPGFAARFDRQVRMFGPEGQHILGSAKVMIVGLGGVGMLLAEYLGRLGVGNVVLVDPDRVSITNLPRLPEATEFDAMSWLTRNDRPGWLRRLGGRMATRKIDLARRIIRKANSKAVVSRIFTAMETAEVTDAAKDCDYIFLAADSHRARRLFNALVHQYLIPGVQLGSRIQSDPASGSLVNVHTTARLVTPDRGCLLCNEAVSAARLQEESTPDKDRERQKYTDEPDIVAPSVITLNALAASQAANDFLFYVTGLARPEAFEGYVQSHPLIRRTKFVQPRRDAECPDCGGHKDSRLAHGDERPIPLID